MTDYRKFFDKPYLGHWDLPDGKDVVVVIDNVEAGELHVPGKKAEKKPLLTLRKTDKKMVCNATNSKTIAKLYGNSVEEWIGKPIALYKTTTNAQGGEQVECIRVRPTPPKPRQRQADPEPGASDAPDEEAP